MQALDPKRSSISKEEAQKILSDRPYQNGFHFFTAVGKYSGETAINLFSFYEELRTIEPVSLKFHSERRDFQNWIKNTLGDEMLAKRIDDIKQGLSEPDFRNELRSVILARIQELQIAAKV